MPPLLLCLLWNSVLTCRAPCTGGSRPSSERVACCRSRNQSPLREKSNNIKPSADKFITGALHGSSPLQEFICMQTTRTRETAHGDRGEMWQTHVVTFMELFKSCRDARMIWITLWDQTPLRGAIQGHGGVATEPSQAMCIWAQRMSGAGPEHLWAGVRRWLASHRRNLGRNACSDYSALIRRTAHAPLRPTRGQLYEVIGASDMHAWLAVWYRKVAINARHIIMFCLFLIHISYAVDK